MKLAGMFSFFIITVFFLSHAFPSSANPSQVIEHTMSNGTPPLDVFQVQAPVRASFEGASCQQVILQHNFAASYGTPYVGEVVQRLPIHFIGLTNNRNLLTTH